MANPTTRQRLALMLLRPGPLHLAQGQQGGLGPTVHGRLGLRPPLQQQVQPTLIQAKVKIG
jgi:hypothetical protein